MIGNIRLFLQRPSLLLVLSLYNLSILRRSLEIGPVRRNECITGLVASIDGIAIDALRIDFVRKGTGFAADRNGITSHRCRLTVVVSIRDCPSDHGDLGRIQVCIRHGAGRCVLLVEIIPVPLCIQALVGGSRGGNRQFEGRRDLVQNDLIGRLVRGLTG